MIFFILSTFDKHDKGQSLAKLKNMQVGFRATLNFRKFKEALNPNYAVRSVLSVILEK